MRITLIAAMDSNRLIGSAGTLPWQLPNDLKHFRDLTLNKTILMGRKTFESIGQALPKRRNIIISRNPNFKADSCEVYSDINKAMLALTKEKEIIVIGGANIYTQLLPKAACMHLTLIEAALTGDTYFPKWNKDQWQLTSEEKLSADKSHKYNYKFITLVRTSY